MKAPSWDISLIILAQSVRGEKAVDCIEQNLLCTHLGPTCRNKYFMRWNSTTLRKRQHVSRSSSTGSWSSILDELEKLAKVKLISQWRLWVTCVHSVHKQTFLSLETFLFAPSLLLNFKPTQLRTQKNNIEKQKTPIFPQSFFCWGNEIKKIFNEAWIVPDCRCTDNDAAMRMKRDEAQNWIKFWVFLLHCIELDKQTFVQNSDGFRDKHETCF